MYSYCQGVSTKVVFNSSLKILSVNVGLIWKATEVARWPVVCLGSSTVSPSVGQQQSRDQYQDTAAAAAPMYHSPVCQLAAIPPTIDPNAMCNVHRHNYWLIKYNTKHSRYTDTISTHLQRYASMRHQLTCLGFLYGIWHSLSSHDAVNF